jgi:hypothetical protein
LEKTETFTAYGHRLVQATHWTTFEFTKERHLTVKGDCIIAVKANKGCVDLSKEFREAARNPEATVTITIEAGGTKETIQAKGDPRLSFTHPTDMVVRKSRYVCSRTLAVKANKAAGDLSRSLVAKLRNPDQKVIVTLAVKVPDRGEPLF